MPYLDVSPMIAALRRTPEEFELVDGWLHHIRSWHSFRFGPNDEVEIRAACNCALLAIRPEQERELASGFREWNVNHWRPLLVNREFASHFAQKPGLRQALITLTARLHRWLLQWERRRHHSAGLVAEMRRV